VRESEALIRRWHNKGRQHYAITVRFAPTSTHAQMKLAGELAARIRMRISRPTSPRTPTK
jgi:guanine deaminase